MWEKLIRFFLGVFLTRVVGNFVALLKTARADDEDVAKFVKRKVAEAEVKFRTGAERQFWVDVETKKYVAELGKEIATAGIHALTLSAMQELGLIVSP